MRAVIDFTLRSRVTFRAFSHVAVADVAVAATTGTIFSQAIIAAPAPTYFLNKSKPLCLTARRAGCFAHNGVWQGLRSQGTSAIPDVSHIVADKPARTDRNSMTGKGQIDIIVGPMFSGKTTELLRRLNEARDVGRRVLCIKSGKDNRYSDDEAVTHDGKRMACIAIHRLEHLLPSLQSGEFKDVEMVGIDEAQFFEDLEPFCAAAADLLGKTVVVAGLDGDFRRRPFGKVLDLVPKSDSVTKLRAVCKYCTGDAVFTVRVVAETSTELIGGADSYVPVCRAHYLDEKVNIHG